MTAAGVLPLGEVAVRLGAATIAGAVLGANRNLHGKAAGLRTHALVALGAALVTAAAAQADAAGSTRVMQGVITGIGFLGAGVILHPRPEPPATRRSNGGGATDGATPARPRARPRSAVRGLTTAATVWVAAGLGLASGLGAWAIVLVGTVLTLVILAGGGRVETGVRQRLRRRLRRRRLGTRRPLEHHHRAGHEVRVGERQVRADDA
ncbi:MAG TPA: MgtC/SapB family protein [Gemmatirosa sp.]